MNHLSYIQMRFTVNNFISGWQPVQKGIMAGFTESLVLFVAAMNVLMTGVNQCRRPKTEEGTNTFMYVGLHGYCYYHPQQG